MAATSASASDYKEVVGKLREINTLKGISGLLGWDEMVMLPEGSSDCRGDQKTVLAGVLYDKESDPTLGKLLNSLKGDSSLDNVQTAVIRDAQRSYVKTTALPKELVQRMAQLETDGYNAWIESRTKKDFNVFAPVLKEWVEVNKEKAKCIDPTIAAYDVLLDDFEKGMTTARIDEIFSEVREGLVPLIADMKSRGTPPDDKWMSGEYETEKQAELCKSIALDIGFDITKGRLDVSVHPFTGGAHPTDVRMTTRFKANDLLEGLTGAIHETGHALYEQGRNLDEAWRDLPVSEALSMGVHESQSLLWERMVCLSKPFQHYLLPKIQAAFPDSGFSGKSPEELYKAINTIKDPSMIRVEADEVTYAMHVILRYEIERGLINGDIAVEEVPGLWNNKMQEYLGVTPEDDARGCCQDVHWSGGAMGYFPTYSLGAMYACQIFSYAKTCIPDLEDQIARGDFKPLKLWLNEKIHRLGSLYQNGDELMIAVTGKPLDTSIFLGYLREKYTEIYKL